MVIDTCLSIIILNVNGLNTSIKTESGKLNWKQEPAICCLYLRAKDTQSKSEGMDRGISWK